MQSFLTIKTLSYILFRCIFKFDVVNTFFSVFLFGVSTQISPTNHQTKIQQLKITKNDPIKFINKYKFTGIKILKKNNNNNQKPKRKQQKKKQTQH